MASAFQAPFGVAPGIIFPVPVISPVFNNGHGTNKLMSVLELLVGASCSEASHKKLVRNELEDVQ